MTQSHVLCTTSSPTRGFTGSTALVRCTPSREGGFRSCALQLVQTSKANAVGVVSRVFSPPILPAAPVSFWYTHRRRESPRRRRRRSAYRRFLHPLHPLLHPLLFTLLSLIVPSNRNFPSFPFFSAPRRRGSRRRRVFYRIRFSARAGARTPPGKTRAVRHTPEGIAPPCVRRRRGRTKRCSCPSRRWREDAP